MQSFYSARLRLVATCVALAALAVGCSGRHGSTGSLLPSGSLKHAASASTYDSVVLGLGPYAYYRLDETTGTVAHDASGHGRDGTYQGTVGTHYQLGQTSVVPGLAASLKTFAASPGSAKVTLPALNLGSSTTAWVSDFSVAAWVKPDPSQLSQLSAALEINGYYVGESGGASGTSGTVPFMGGYVNGGEYFSPSTTFADGKSHLLVLTVHYNASGYCDLNL